MTQPDRPDREDFADAELLDAEPWPHPHVSPEELAEAGPGSMLAACLRTWPLYDPEDPPPDVW